MKTNSGASRSAVVRDSLHCVEGDLQPCVVDRSIIQAPGTGLTYAYLRAFTLMLIGNERELAADTSCRERSRRR